MFFFVFLIYKPPRPTITYFLLPQQPQHRQQINLTIIPITAASAKIIATRIIMLMGLGTLKVCIKLSQYLLVE